CAERDGHNYADVLLAGHDEPRECADDQTHHQCAENRCDHFLLLRLSPDPDGVTHSAAESTSQLGRYSIETALLLKLTVRLVLLVLSCFLVFCRRVDRVNTSRHLPAHCGVCRCADTVCCAGGD